MQKKSLMKRHCRYIWVKQFLTPNNIEQSRIVSYWKFKEGNIYENKKSF